MKDVSSHDEGVETERMSNESILLLQGKPLRFAHAMCTIDKTNWETFKFKVDLEIVNKHKKATFDTLEDLQAVFVANMNMPHSTPLYVYNVTPSYVHVYCNICKHFRVWFTYQRDKEGKPVKLAWHRYQF